MSEVQQTHLSINQSRVVETIGGTALVGERVLVCGWWWQTITAAFEMDEILYAMRDHSLGLNCGRYVLATTYV